MADRIDTTRLTNEVGNPVADNNHTLTAGERGPMMLQDNWMIEKLAHFDREVIPERRMHAKGSGAYGTFKVTGDISKYTKAKVLQPGGRRLPARRRDRGVRPLLHRGGRARRG